MNELRIIMAKLCVNKVPYEAETPLSRLRVDMECDRDFAMFGVLNVYLNFKVDNKIKRCFLKNSYF